MYLLIVLPMKAIGLSLLLIKHPQIICDVLPFLSLPYIFSTWHFSYLFWCWNTHTIWPKLSLLTAHSLDHITLFQSSLVQCRYTLTHFKHSTACLFVNNSLLTAFHFHIPDSCSRCRIVCSEILRLVLSCNSLRDIWVLDKAI